MDAEDTKAKVYWSKRLIITLCFATALIFFFTTTHGDDLELPAPTKTAAKAVKEDSLPIFSAPLRLDGNVSVIPFEINTPFQKEMVRGRYADARPPKEIQLEQLASIIARIETKYSSRLVKQSRPIFLIASLGRDSKRAAGVTFDDFIVLDSQLAEHPKYVIEKTVHHELAHLFVQYWNRLFPFSKWQKLNASLTLDDYWNLSETPLGYYKLGFVSVYAMKNIHEDIAETASYVEIHNFKLLKAEIDRGTVIGNKYKLWLQFVKDVTDELNKHK